MILPDLEQSWKRMKCDNHNGEETYRDLTK